MKNSKNIIIYNSNFDSNFSENGFGGAIYFINRNFDTNFKFKDLNFNNNNSEK